MKNLWTGHNQQDKIRYLKINPSINDTDIDRMDMSIIALLQVCKKCTTHWLHIEMHMYVKLFK